MDNSNHMPDEYTQSHWLQLEALYLEADEEQAAIRRLTTRLGKVMTDIAIEEFPYLKKMSAEQIREFGDAVSRTGTNFAMRAASLAFAAERAG
jgi:hypothetical protein